MDEGAGIGVLQHPKGAIGALFDIADALADIPALGGFGADTGDTQFGSLVGHGTPMRRLIESGAVRGDRFLQIGLRGYWPEPPTLAWMAEQRMRVRDERDRGAGSGFLPR